MILYRTPPSVHIYEFFVCVVVVFFKGFFNGLWSKKDTRMHRTVGSLWCIMIWGTVLYKLLYDHEGKNWWIIIFLFGLLKVKFCYYLKKDSISIVIASVFFSTETLCTNFIYLKFYNANCEWRHISFFWYTIHVCYKCQVIF